MKKILLILAVLIGCVQGLKAEAVTDVITYDKILNKTYEDITYNSPATGVSYLSSLYAENDVDAMFFQDDATYKAAFTAAAPEGLNLVSLAVRWTTGGGVASRSAVLVVYGSDTPYASSHDAFDETKLGTEIGRAAYGTKEVTLSGKYRYVLLKMELAKYEMGALKEMSLSWEAAPVTDVITCDKILNKTYEDITYNSPTTGVSYLSSLYAENDVDAMFFQDDATYQAAFAAAAPRGATLAGLTVRWTTGGGVASRSAVLVVYGSETPYTSSHDAFDETKLGTEIGRAAYGTKEVTLTGAYRYILLKMELAKYEMGALKEMSFAWAGEVAKVMEPIVVTTAAGDVIESGTKLNIFEPVKLTVSTDTPDVAYEWTLGDKTGTATEAFTLDVTEDCDLSIVATKEGYNLRDFSASFTYYPPVKSIADFWLRNTLYYQGVDREFTVDFDATVTAAANVNGDTNVYITDGKNFSMIHLQGKTLSYAPGDVIAGGWKAKFGKYVAFMALLPQEELTVSSHDGAVPEPVAVGNTDVLETLDPGTPVVVRQATLTTATSGDVFFGNASGTCTWTKDASGNDYIPMVNALGLPAQEAGTYDIYGIAHYYAYHRTNAPAVRPTDGDYNHFQWTVAPTRWEVWLPTAPRPRFELSTGAEVDSGEPIVITCQDAEATIMYRFDEEEYAKYDPDNKPVMPARDVTVSAYAVKEGNHDSAVRTVSLRYSGKAGIESISADAAGEARYYDLQGRPVAKPASGLYIKVENGKATKVTL